jgi:hypothetical protein
VFAVDDPGAVSTALVWASIGAYDEAIFNAITAALTRIKDDLRRQFEEDWAREHGKKLRRRGGRRAAGPSDESVGSEQRPLAGTSACPGGVHKRTPQTVQDHADASDDGKQAQTTLSLTLTLARLPLAGHGEPL